jgi:hypothetical protein
VHDLEPLRGLTHLEHLAVILEPDNAQAGYLGPLELLTRLRYLELDVLHTGTLNLKPSEQLTRLETLVLEMQPSDDLQPILKLKRLKHLTLVNSGTNIGQLKGIQFDHVNLLPWSEDEAKSLKPLLGVKQLTVTDRGRNNLEQTLQLPGLEQLALEVDDSSADVNLTWLKSLRTSTSLSLTIDRPANAGLSILPNLTTLRALSMRNLTASDRIALQNMPKNVTELDF